MIRVPLIGIIAKDIQEIMENEKMTPLEYLGEIAMIKDIGNTILGSFGEGVAIMNEKKYALVLPNSNEEDILKLIGAIRLAHLSWWLDPKIDKSGELEYFLEKMQTGTGQKHTRDKAYA